MSLEKEISPHEGKIYPWKSNPWGQSCIKMFEALAMQPTDDIFTEVGFVLLTMMNLYH